MKTVDELPERVLFVNMQSGSVFFDCHPSEARVAMRTVTELREGRILAEKSKQITEQLEKILSATIDQECELEAEVQLTARHYADMFAKIEKEATMLVEVSITDIVMNALTYSTLRKWDRDVLTAVEDKELVHVGFMASLWGAQIIVSGGVVENEILFAFERKKKNHSVKKELYRFRITILPRPPSPPSIYERVEKELQGLREDVKALKRSHSPVGPSGLRA